MNKHEPPATVQYALRLPAHVKELLEAKAAEARRSLNNEMVVRLENSLKTEGAAAKQAA
jgi:hypothetical protein